MVLNNGLLSGRQDCAALFARLINLIEKATIREVDFLGFAPITSDVLQREQT